MPNLDSSCVFHQEQELNFVKKKKQKKKQKEKKKNRVMMYRGTLKYHLIRHCNSCNRISYRTSRNRGNENLSKSPRSRDQYSRHAHIW